MWVGSRIRFSTLEYRCKMLTLTYYIEGFLLNFRFLLKTDIALLELFGIIR